MLGAAIQMAVLLKHPFSSLSQEEIIPAKLVQFQISYPVAHCQTLLSTPNQTIESQFEASAT